MDKKEHRFNYEWTLKDAKFTKDKGTVFSCFACGGGFTMGYKLAGFDVIGMNEIDPKMADAYIKNHNPKYAYIEPIQEFKKRKDLPKELYNLDILDGSPPCSTFSMSGNREKDWGKKKKFKEGQACQVLDDLFFHFIDLAKNLQPKIVVAENVKGLLLGNAIKYVRRIYKEFDSAGYYVQHWLLNAAKMGVPQRRERVFFIALRKDLANQFLYQKNLFTVVPKLELNFNEKEILFKEIKENESKGLRQKLLPAHAKLYKKRKYGDKSLCDISNRLTNKQKFFNHRLLYDNEVCGTITAHRDNTCFILFDKQRYLTKKEFEKIGAFPADYDYVMNNPGYLIGMSVPPVMMANIATEIYNQWLSKI